MTPPITNRLFAKTGMELIERDCELLGPFQLHFPELSPQDLSDRTLGKLRHEFHQLRRDDAGGAVTGREGLVEAGHAAADGRALFHEVDVEARRGEIERCLYAGDPGALIDGPWDLPSYLPFSVVLDSDGGVVARVEGGTSFAAAKRLVAPLLSR